MFFVFCYPKLKYTNKIISNIIQWTRSIAPDVFLGKGVLKIYSTFTGEHTEVRSNFPANIRLQKTSSRRLDQDEYVCLSLTSSEDVLGKTNIFVLVIPLQDVFKTSCKNVFKTFWRRLQDVCQIYLQDVFKAYHQVQLFLLTRLREIFNTLLRHSFQKTVIYRGICLGNTISEKFMVSVQNL